MIIAVYRMDVCAYVYIHIHMCVLSWEFGKGKPSGSPGDSSNAVAVVGQPIA